MTHDQILSIVGKIRAAATLYECDFLDDEWIVAPPCEVSELAAFKAHFGEKIPESLLRFFTCTSAHVDICWYLIGDFPKPFSDIGHGELALSPELVVKADRGRAQWTRKVFPNPNDPYDRLWHVCRGLMHLSCGDYIAWDGSERIIYLSHDGSTEQHGYVLAQSFEDFIRDFLLLGAPNPEFGWSIFTKDSESGISTTSESARLWMDLFYADQVVEQDEGEDSPLW